MRYAIRTLKNTYHPLQVPDSLTIEHGQMILVRTDKGEEAFKAQAVCCKVAKKWEEFQPEIFPVIRTLSPRDLETLEEIKKEEVEAFFKCKELIKRHRLGMNLVQSKMTFDRKKVSFYYTAAERVDFRELLKDLTQTFKRMRIDLRHIGVRDETSILEGVGICGKEFCCCSFLRKFESINVKLAKDQGMPISPGKISGTCGRLLCCLNYEYGNYIDAAKELPPIGSAVMTPDGLGKVFALKILNNNLAVKLEDGKIKDYAKADIEMVDAEVNVEIETPVVTYAVEDGEKIDLKQLEDDRNSSTGNV